MMVRNDMSRLRQARERRALQAITEVRKGHGQRVRDVPREQAQDAAKAGAGETEEAGMKTDRRSFFRILAGGAAAAPAMAAISSKPVAPIPCSYRYRFVIPPGQLRNVETSAAIDVEAFRRAWDNAFVQGYRQRLDGLVVRSVFVRNDGNQYVK